MIYGVTVNDPLFDGVSRAKKSNKSIRPNNGERQLKIFNYSDQHNKK